MNLSRRTRLITAVLGIVTVATTGVVWAQTSSPEPSDALRNAAENPNGLARSISAQQRQELDEMIRPAITTSGPLFTQEELDAMDAKAIADMNAIDHNYTSSYQNPRAYEHPTPDNPGEITRGGPIVYDLDASLVNRRYIRVATTTTGTPTIRISYVDCAGEIVPTQADDLSVCDLTTASWSNVAIPSPNTNLELDPTVDNTGMVLTFRDRSTLSQRWTFNMATLAVTPVTNRPPVCTTVTVSPALIWPASHELTTVTIAGVTDPDGDVVAVTIAEVAQDEPVNGTGDGDTAPDAVLGSGPSLRVRAERSGNGDGRVYRIKVNASDGKGGTCSTTALVSVPRNANAVAVDSGYSYNSLLP